MGWLHRVWCDWRTIRSMTEDALVMQREFAKVVGERNAALARIHVMETRMKERLKHEDHSCLLCYLWGDK